MHATTLLIATLSFVPSDEPKVEESPPVVKKALDGYLKAVAAKDLDAMAALSGVPWLDRDSKVIRDPDALRKALERVMSQLPADEGERKVEVLSFKKVRDNVRDEADRKLLDDVLGPNGYFISVTEGDNLFSERIILIRLKDDKATIVAGPLKPNQVNPQNRIPESVEGLLAKADTFELYSLDPAREPEERGKAEPAKDTFHGWKVLGKTEVKGEAERKGLADALRLGAEDNFGVVAACFIPRHGLRLTGGGKTVDLVICFQCLSVQVFMNGERKGGFLTTGDPQKAFDAVLKAAGVKLPEAAKEK
jgi:hypothetical protein